MCKLRYQSILCFLVCVLFVANSQDLPRILKSKQGDFQLTVHGKPFLMLSGELANSAASDADLMKSIWPKLRDMNLNTVLAPVYWELLEPEEGKFDFSLVEAMIKQARDNNLKLVLLWFGTWKNSMSCYAPAWVKKDYIGFPRTLDSNGRPAEIVSVFSDNALKADINAFKALMRFIKHIDSKEHTVIMVQVENEIGQLPEARDYSFAANKAFQSNVPKPLLDYLSKNKKILLPHVKKLWEENGTKNSGSWETVFGKSLATDELFMAWHFAVFANQIAKAGKEIYNLPMFVNCALNRPGLAPGKYPSGGPLPHLLNIWQAGSPDIDMLSPDIYHGDFRHWVAQYDKLNNPVFLPEIKAGEENAAQVLYVMGRHKALGFSPFSIENANDAETVPLSKSYKLLDDISDLLHDNRMKSTGVYLDKQISRDTVLLGNYQIIVSHVSTLPWSDGARLEKWIPAGCVIIETAPDEFWIGGTAIACTFKNISDSSISTGILSADLCSKTDKAWHFVRLNGDETHQGRHFRISSSDWQIQRVRLYQYK